MSVVSLDAEREVLKRYESASKAREDALCCPVEYDGKYLHVIPQEILDRDYGCGDPSRFVREGETVLDLGSGGGKICYIISQIVGPEGRVIGVDFNPAMLGLAESHRQTVAERIGWDNITFLRARIQDLHTDIAALETRLGERPVDSYAAYREIEDFRSATPPLIADNSIDLVVSNCVLNLVRAEDKAQLFQEMFRVLKPRGRVAVSDIVSDEEVPGHMAQDPELWSGCISGAYQEREFPRAFENAGFHGITIEKRDQEPWQTVEGIEFRAVTVTAHKGKQGPCLERNQAVIYGGPWRRVEDDDGHVLERGVRAAVCDKTYGLLTGEPYGEGIIGVPPRVAVPLGEAPPFDCARDAPRHPRETKGAEYRLTTEASGECCSEDPEETGDSSDSGEDTSRR